MANGKVVYNVNNEAVGKGNWLKFVRSSKNKSEQNLVVIQDSSKIYYRAWKDIQIGDELVVWYADQFNEHGDLNPIKSEVSAEQLTGNLMIIQILFFVLQFSISKLSSEINENG